MRREYRITAETGLHARPSSLLVQAAAEFPNEINIEYKEKRFSLKSILLVMSLGVPQNAIITIEVDGDNSNKVFEVLENILEKNKLV